MYHVALNETDVESMTATVTADVFVIRDHRDWVVEVTLHEKRAIKKTKKAGWSYERVPDAVNLPVKVEQTPEEPAWVSDRGVGWTLRHPIYRYLNAQTIVLGGPYDVGDGKRARTLRWVLKSSYDIIEHIGVEYMIEILLALEDMVLTGAIGRDYDSGEYHCYDFHSGEETFLEYIED